MQFILYFFVLILSIFDFLCYVEFISKFTGLHDMLQSALTTLQEAFDWIQVPQVSDGEQYILKLLREAQVVKQT